MNIIIEDLKYQDIEECYEMNKLIFDYDAGIDSIKELYSKIADEKNRYRFLVAKVDNTIVGYVSCIIDYNLFDGSKPFMTLWWLGTHPDYRKKGIATKLFTKIEEIANENNCGLIYFISNNSRVEAHKFYQNLGYIMDSKGFKKYL